MTSPTQPDEALRKKIEHIRKCYYNSVSPDDGTRYDGFGSMNSEQFTHNFLTLIAAEVQAAEKAYGGCHKCYGKGYATVIKGVKGYADFLGDKDFKIPPHNQMVYCSCERGKQLEALLSPIAGEGGKE